uniref:Proteinase-activated receptor 1 n=1 Tax=Salarias fasciatus TaxID=181472 RepID=A0A672FV14_SALFA
MMKRLFKCESICFCLAPGSGPVSRTFSARFVMVSEEPVDYLDLSALDMLGDDGGSGSPPEPAERPVHHGPHRHPHHHKHHVVSEETKAFLRGRLATVFVPTVYTLVFIVSVPLNLVAAVVFARHIRPKSSATVYMLNLACADLLFGLLLPFKIAYHYHGNNWTYGSFMCRAVTAAFHCNMYCSVLLIMCISVDRFLSVVHPVNSPMWRSPLTASAVCAAMWLLSLGGVIPLLTSGQTVYLSDLHITSCHDVQPVGKLHSYYLYFFPIYSSVFFFIPLVFTAACYLRVLQALATADMEDRSRRARAVVMTVTVLAMFVVCFTPTNIILMVHYVQLGRRAADSSYQAYLLSMCLSSLSCCLDPCCLDPLLYYFGSSQCREQMAALWGRGRALWAERGLEAPGATGSWRESSRTCKMEAVETGTGDQYSRLVD